MLKIKDNVDLKELESFGFKYTGNYNRGDRWEREMYIIVNGKDLGGIIVTEYRKVGFIHPYIKGIEYPEIEPYVEDLIQAGLVEKVEK